MPINKTPVSANEDNNVRTKNEAKVNFYVVTPKYTFDDIVIPEKIIKSINNIIALNEYGNLIFDTWGLSKVIKSNRGITINLFGKSGTGKTMAAHAIAHKLKKQLLIVDYSEIESKYVGETSKNLVKMFKEAESLDAVILFDEADALLSKRVTSMNNATDVSVNQTRNVLLKLLDEYNGIVIFTTNFISNFDSAFLRRILSSIEFPEPDLEMRKRLWTHYLVDELPLSDEKETIVEEISKIDGVTGADISNAVLRAALSAASNHEKISLESLKTELNDVLSAKHEIEREPFNISTKTVSGEYVKKQLGVDN